MKILVAHNYYKDRGGEDVVFENEVRLLKSAGQEVRAITVSNDTIKSPLENLMTAIRAAKNPTGVASMAQAIREFQPNIVHVHNFFPLLSPAVYQVCHLAGIPVVQTLHNFRTFCAAAVLAREGNICRLCINGSPIWAVRYRCYRGSIIGSAAVARMIAVHRKQKTWSTLVDRYIALSRFGRDLFIEAGFPAERIDIKPNFIEDPGVPPDDISRNGVLFVGRLSSEKGVRYLVEACASRGYPLRIVGTGPEFPRIRQLASPNVIFLGNLRREVVLDEMRRAAVIVLPSIWYEGMPMVVIEAFASATPVIVSRIGALPEIVEDGVTGFHVPPANSNALAERIGHVLRNPDEARRLGQAGRRTFLREYTSSTNLKLLEAIYERCLQDVLMRPKHRKE
jgi:glycosyltransferase involved in cell wall biosynthesis